LRDLLAENSEASVRRAAKEFEELTRKYKEALADAKYNKVTTAVASMLAVGSALTVAAGPLVGVFAAVATPLFSIRQLMKPSWKDLEEKQCFPAGVVFAAEELV
jgi:hypothetical protein